MRMIVAGCGKIGTTIIENFVKEGHEVMAVDMSPALVQEITNTYDVMAICGNAADSDTLSEAGVDKTQLFIAVTGSDELNMLACFVAKRMGAEHTVARIRTPGYNDQSLAFMRQQLDISIAINPDKLAAQELFKILKLPSAITVETFSRRQFEMIELHLHENSALSGVSLMELRQRYAAKVLVCIVQRNDEVYIPDGTFVLQAGDRIGIAAIPTEINKFLRLVGVMQKQAKNVMLLGGSRTAYYLAKMLMDNGTSVKIIEKNAERCRELSNALPNATIIHGDGIQQDLLMEEDIGNIDAFVALTGMDEENILVSFFAAAQEVPKVVPKVNRNELAHMAEKLGLECIISPRKIITDVLSRFSRALHNSMGSKVEALYKLMDGQAEALEFIVQPDFEGIGVTLKDLTLKRNILIAGIIRGRKCIIPSGADTIQAGDKVIVIAAGRQLSDLADILQ